MIKMVTPMMMTTLMVQTLTDNHHENNDSGDDNDNGSDGANNRDDDDDNNETMRTLLITTWPPSSWSHFCPARGPQRSESWLFTRALSYLSWGTPWNRFICHQLKNEGWTPFIFKTWGAYLVSNLRIFIRSYSRPIHHARMNIFRNWPPTSSDPHSFTILFFQKTQIVGTCPSSSGFPWVHVYVHAVQSLQVFRGIKPAW